MRHRRKGRKLVIHIMRGIPRQAVHQNTPIKGTDKRARDIAMNSICPWNSDMYGVDVSLPEGQLYYDSLLELYASWGVDFIKVDDIGDSKIYGDAHKAEIKAIRRAIDRSGREIVLSLSPGPAALKNGSFFQNHANMWRLTDDFWDHWDALYAMFDRAAEWAPSVQVTGLTVICCRWVISAFGQLMVAVVTAGHVLRKTSNTY